MGRELIMIRYFTLVTWELEVSRARGRFPACDGCDRVCRFVPRGDTFFYFGFLRAMFSRPECTAIAPLCLFRARVNLVVEWIGEMISPNFHDAIDDDRGGRDRLAGGGRSTKPVA